MKPNELRIGNFVYWNNEKVEIDSISETEITLKTFFNIKIKMDAIKPIPLSYEWIETLGFEKIRHVNGYIFWVHKRSKIEIYFDRNMIKWNGFPVKCPLKFHHLQNLYYSLTGEELV
jgi:hypothetical protein